MAFAAKLGALTDELVEVITSTPDKKINGERYNVLRESSLRSLRYHSFLRTNQFDVENQLVGLEERFRVHHREGLADAFRERLDALSQFRTKWHPDILHFLLELADRPTQKTRLSDLELLNQPEEDTKPPLRWEDIAKEDRWYEDADIWKSIDYSDTSGDEYGDSKSETSSESDDTSLSTLDASFGRRPEDFEIASSDETALREVQDSQAWRIEAKTTSSTRQHKVPITEFQATRDALFMLQGLPTTLFQKDGLPNPAYQIVSVAWDTYKALITCFAESGRQLFLLRSFSKRAQTAPLFRVFRDNVLTSLQSFDKKISAIQERLAVPREDTIVSMSAILEELKPHLEPLRSLSEIVRQLYDPANGGAFRFLELLYDEIGIAQLSGRDATYEFLGRIFFNCFQVYLRPIRLWMSEGQLMPGDKVFFVSELPTQVPLRQVWQEQFKLRRTSDGVLHAPSFLQPSVGKVFTAGKSIVVLKHLGKFESLRELWDEQEPPLTFDTICPPGLELAPFPELFTSSFNLWMQSKYHATSETLKQALFDSCGLEANIEALQQLYLMADGAAADEFCKGVFARLDALRPDWHDRYSLSGLAQEAFLLRVDTTRLFVTVRLEGQKKSVVAARDLIRTALPEVLLQYRLPWPVQLVVTEDTITQYQAVFTLLMQIRRAMGLIQRNRILDELASRRDIWGSRALYYLLRSKLMWFCNCIRTYLATLVLAPYAENLRRSLRQASDVDAMIGLHATFVKQVVDAACLGRKLDPIRSGILDIMDLAAKLEDAQSASVAEEAEEAQELSRLSIMSSPMKASPRRRKPAVYAEDSDDDDAKSFGGRSKGGAINAGKDYHECLQEIKTDFERHLRFICGGLRGVARASSDEAAVKWDLLAEMLEMGVKDGA
ncbi:gamma-tubulin complex component [Colletotrichum tofieldiae]|uniref:Spindle pole body component n=1 Tax=Colletotrichum tofieldiae TaxID=708197 RepID=A0A161VES3_9PEZI|nr:gamma-tubulin complex component (Spc97/Spc98 family protein) [Colletotrichum tofieldiae]GKT58711.1 gamma-tubulin complex component [Colletotrichum tofieldiae]GKT77866.1 gamma-tubulin complex component [Colletotrichum tofieldiae]